MRHLSLFSGSGIGTLAAAHCCITTVAHAENDPACCFALRKLWPDSHLFEDVHDVSAESLWRFSPIDVISGGFPCQDLSTAGRGAGIEGSRSGLWREMFRIIRQVRPAWVLVENVPAIRLRGVDRVIAPLERISYTCWPLVVGAWAVGAPHRRNRLWLLAHRNDSGCDRICENVGKPGAVASGRDKIGGGGELADADKTRREEHMRFGDDNGPQPPPAFRSRWPTRPGEPQHEWEATRLAQFGVGNATDGLAGRLRSRANKCLLRMAGNGWTYPNALLMFQAIVEMEATREES